MKVLFDTNIIIDIWGKAPDFFHSYTAYDVALVKRFEPCIAATMVTDFTYLLTARKLLPSVASREAFGQLLDVFQVLDVNATDCKAAFACGMTDLEDAIIAQCAARHGVDFIVTRNKRDFAKSPIPALTPEEFLEIYQPTCLHYEMVEW